MQYLYSDLISLLNLILIFIVVFFDYRKNKRRLNTLQSISAAFILYYIFVPFLIRYYNLRPSLLNFRNTDYTKVQIWILCGYIVFLFCYYSTKYLNLKLIKFRNYNPSRDYIYYLNRILLIANIIFFVGTICNIYYYYSMGGIANALNLAELLRGDITFNQIIYTIPFLSLARMFMPLVNISTFLYLYLISKKINRIKFKFLISLIFTLIYMLFNASKLHALFTISSFALFFLVGKNRKVIFNILVFAIVSLVLLEPLNSLFYSLQYGSFNFTVNINSSYASYFKEFFFPYANLLNVENYTINDKLRYGFDFIAIFIDILPSKLLNMIGYNEPLSSHILNTYNYTGGVWTAGMPTDLVTLGYYQFREFGVILISMFLGIISSYFDKNLNKLGDDKGDFLIRIRSLMFFFLIVPYSDPIPILRNRIDYLFFVLLVLYLSNRNEEYKKNAGYLND